MPDYNYFSEEEFNKLTPPCSLNDMSVDFMKRLDQARSNCGFPFRLSCAYRSKDWDLSKGRSGKSYHTFGKAVDIKCTDSYYRFRIIEECLKVGLTGIGIAPTFIHVDSRPSTVIWLYD